jgi:hypothetical protein
LGVLLLAGLIGGAVAFSNAQKKQQELQAQLTDLTAKQEENNRKMADLNDQLGKATTPEQKAALEQQIADAQKKAADLANAASQVKSGTTVRTGGVGVVAQPRVLPKCKCAGNGDPLCAEIRGSDCQ